MSKSNAAVQSAPEPKKRKPRTISPEDEAMQASKWLRQIAERRNQLAASHQEKMAKLLDEEEAVIGELSSEGKVKLEQLKKLAAGEA